MDLKTFAVDHNDVSGDQLVRKLPDHKNGDNKMKLIDGRIVINVHDMLCEMSTAEKREIADELACQDDMIKDVTDQILGGWTDLGSRSWNDSSDPDPKTPLGQARHLLAKSSGAIASAVIGSLTEQLRYERDWRARNTNGNSLHMQPEKLAVVLIKDLEARFTGEEVEAMQTRTAREE